MPPWLRVIGVRLALLALLPGLLATVFATHGAAGKPDLPYALLESFDQAFSLVYDAAERRVAELEATPPAPRPPRDVFALLRVLEGQLAVALDTTAAHLDVELALAGSLPPERRIAARACIDRHLDETRAALEHTTDPQVRDEYWTTCEQLCEVRRLV
ncbi:MAG TPA: hypothetical protein VF469_09615 [Kofleriaceae bacterium]